MRIIREKDRQGVGESRIESGGLGPRIGCVGGEGVIGGVDVD